MQSLHKLHQVTCSAYRALTSVAFAKRAQRVIVTISWGSFSPACLMARYCTMAPVSVCTCNQIWPVSDERHTVRNFTQMLTHEHHQVICTSLKSPSSRAGT